MASCSSIQKGRVLTWAKSAERIKGYDFARGWLIRAIEAVQLLGAKVILAGISAIIADTFVAIGARFSRIKTTADLQSALEEAKNLLSTDSSLS